MKYNSSGTKQWTKQLGTAATDQGIGVITDSSGNIYVSGYNNVGYSPSSSAFDGNPSSGSADMILVKYNSSGLKQWSDQLGTSLADYGWGITIDSSDNIYVTGSTAGDLDENTSEGASDRFLVKYNSGGTKQWTQQLGSSSNDKAYGAATDSSGNIYVTGYTQGSFDGKTYLGSNDIFLVKYNSSGTKQWTKQYGSSSDDSANGIATDSSGNIYVTGYTQGNLDGNHDSGSQDIFLLKYNSSGTQQWIKQLGERNSSDVAEDITVDSSDNIYITGRTNGDLDGETNSGSWDIFLVKYNSDGVLQ